MQTKRDMILKFLNTKPCGELTFALSRENEGLAFYFILFGE